jgi:phosphoribosylamine--glycine ligase
MRVLVVGSGGREHVLCWSIAASPLCEKLYCAPGNAGIEGVAECVPIAADDVDEIVRFAVDKGIGFVVVGPEGPLVAGLVDRLEEAGVAAFGPSAKAAMLEGSKGWMKDLCAKAGVPSGAYGRFRDAAAAKAYIRKCGAPIVVKADGLAAGKGVTVARTVDEAILAVDEAMEKQRFGEAGCEVVVEECLIGEEVSFLALVDGQYALPLASAQDHKAAYDGDRGPNTGGMGAYSPAPLITEQAVEDIMERIMRPMVRALATAGYPFKGVLYAGLMMTQEGPKVLEFNVRFGDPECQVLIPRLQSDLLTALVAARNGTLKNIDLRWRQEAALCVVLAARGYPGAYEKGSEIRGLEKAAALGDVHIFHAGTRRQGGAICANGGRVLGVTALGPTIGKAQARAYEAVDLIDWPDGFCRRDIGWRALAD